MDMFVSLDPRRSERPLVDLSAIVAHPRRGRGFTAEVVEISCEGCRLTTDEPIECGDQLLVSVVDLTLWPARVVWAAHGVIGVEFHQPLEPGTVARYAESFPPQMWVYSESLCPAGPETVSEQL